MTRILEEMDVYTTEIKDAKSMIADLTKRKINVRAEAWKSAEGIAKEKEDYVRSMVSDIQCEIDKLESDVEYYYNQIKILSYKLEIGDV